MLKAKPKDLWWKNYRKRQDRMMKRQSIEMLLRQAYKKTFREYVDNCSIAGVKQMWDPNIGFRQRITWVIIFALMFAAMLYFLHHIWFESLSRPLIVAMETSTYPISKIDFPAVAVCNINRISKRALINFTRSIYPHIAKRNETFAEVLDFCLQMGRLIDFTYNASLRNHPLLEAFEAYLNNTREIIKIMSSLAPSCEEMLLKCYWAGKEVDCMNIFSVRRTIHGHCCVFNYILDYESADNPDRMLAEPKKQNGPGMYLGLAVVLDAKVDDYMYPLYSMRGFEVLIFDPIHFPDPSGGRVIQRAAQPDQAVLIKVISNKQIATREVRKYPPTTRKCLFHDERKKKFNNMYSYSACIVICRIKTVQSLCKCTPYYLPVLLKDGRVCTFEDLKCLNKFKEKLFYLYPIGSTNTDGLEIELVDSLICPDCLPDCEQTQHHTEHMKLPLFPVDSEVKALARHFFDGNMTGKSLLNVYQSSPYGTLNRLDIVSYWFEIVSNIGGFYGILVGFSIITVPEIFYYFVFRFCVRVYNYYVQ